jgi:hypothetical protein
MGAGGVGQVVQCPLSKCEALTSNSSTKKNIKENEIEPLIPATQEVTLGAGIDV